MAFEFKLPDLGEGLTEGEIVKWLVKVGDSIEEGQAFVQFETDKAIVEIPSPRKGIVLKLGAAEGDLSAATGTSSPERVAFDFSTKLGADFAWDLHFTGSEWVMSFPDDAVVVDSSRPSDSQLESDFVMLPNMTLTNIRQEGDLLTATLTPTQSFRIQAVPGGETVLDGRLKTGAMLAIGTTHVAYSEPADDIDVTSFSKSYGTVIPALAADDAAGFRVDLSFTGDTIGGVNLHDLILSNHGSVQGTLSGQVNAVPEPATFAILGLGTVVLVRLRARKLR